MNRNRRNFLGRWLAVALATCALTPAWAESPLVGALSQVDGNGDGQISQQEWLDAARLRFDRFDANHDGVLSTAELQQARDSLRERLRSRWRDRPGGGQ